MTASVLDSPALLGRTEPRLWTPPLRELTPETSYGFEVIDFAREIDHPLLPWQEFAVIHGGEMLDGAGCAPALGVHAEPCGCRPRFRIVVLLVSRQNGKTELPVVLSVFWQFRKQVPLILGTSTQLSYAKESWQKAVSLVRRTRLLDDLHEPGRKWLRRTNGETESWTHDGARYRIAASNSEGGRSLTIHKGIADELRQHRTYEAWDAFEPACSPWDAQIWALSNAGDARSVVLNDLQDAAREFIATGVGDERLGLLEWSAPDGADPEDVDALLQANPRVGYGLDLQVLRAGAARAKRLGGEALTGFKTERMCIRVKLLNPAIDPDGWRECGDGDGLDDVRSRVAMVLDVAPDLRHAVLWAAAVLPDGRVGIDFVQAWEGQGCTAKVRRDLPALLSRTRPQAFGWLPDGPAAALTADLADPAKKSRPAPGRAQWPPPGVKVEEIRGETGAVCMGFADLVDARQIVHSNDPLMNAQVAGAEWLTRGNTRVFSRRGEGHVNAVYAGAGAVHLARTLPAPVGKPRVVTADD